MTPSPHPPALSGAELLQRIRHAQAVWHADDAEHPGLSRAERKAAVVEFLHESPLAPANLSELITLYMLWMALEDPASANAALHQHRGAVLADTCDTDTTLHWGLLELQSRWHFDRDSGVEHLPALIAQLHQTTNPYSAILTHDWEELLRQYQAWNLLDAHLVWYHQLHHRDDPHPWNEAALHRQRAKLAFEAGRREHVEAHLRTQIFYLRQIPPEPSMQDFMLRWAHCARDDVIPFAPRLVQEVIAAARAQLHALVPRPADPILVDCEAQFVRLHARALAEQGRFDEARAIAPGGHFALASDSSQNDEGRDWFGRWMLEWYVKAGRMEEAAELAWQGIWHLRSDLDIDAYQLALEHCDTDTTLPHWHWIVALSGFTEHESHRPLCPPGAVTQTVAAHRTLPEARPRHRARPPHARFDRRRAPGRSSTLAQGTAAARTRRAGTPRLRQCAHAAAIMERALCPPERPPVPAPPLPGKCWCALVRPDW